MMLSPNANFLSNKNCFEPWESLLKTAKTYLVLSSTIYIVLLLQFGRSSVHSTTETEVIRGLKVALNYVRHVIKSV